MDFVRIYTKESKNASKNRAAGSVEVCLDFQVFNTKDLMTRGRSFYAIYDEKKQRWIRNEMAVVRVVNEKILEKVNE